MIAKRIFEIGWETQEIDFKIYFVHEKRTEQKVLEVLILNLYFSTSFDRSDAHKVSLDSPWPGLPESEKKLRKMFV